MDWIRKGAYFVDKELQCGLAGNVNEVLVEERETLAPNSILEPVLDRLSTRPGRVAPIPDKEIQSRPYELSKTLTLHAGRIQSLG